MVDQFLWKTSSPHRTDMCKIYDKRDQAKDICNLFDTFGLDTQHIVLICCSGWPDSMFLSSFLLRYRHIVKWLPMSITKILHIHHNSSPSDDDAENLIDIFYAWVVEICKKKIVDQPHIKYTETLLRKQRRSFFFDCIKKYASLQWVYLCLWHHLDDRIENSFLHFDRWTHLRGIWNMFSYEKKILFHDDWSCEWICCRPLLWIQKNDILHRCKILWLPYIVDTHNHDDTSRRIFYRTHIQRLSTQQKTHFYTDRSYVYTYIESQKIYTPPLLPAKKSPFREIEDFFQTSIPRSLEQLVVLLDSIWIYTNISKKRLQEMMRWFGKSSWSWYINWRWLLLSYGHLYLAKQQTKKLFREPDQTWWTITTPHTIHRWWFDRPIPTYTSWWYLLTFAKTGDRYGSTSFTRRANKQRIPFFWRRSLPIIKKNHIVYDVLPREYRPWRLSYETSV